MINTDYKCTLSIIKKTNAVSFELAAKISVTITTVINAVTRAFINNSLPHTIQYETEDIWTLIWQIESSTTLVLFLFITGTAVPFRMARTLTYMIALSKMDNRNGTLGKIQDQTPCLPTIFIITTNGQTLTSSSQVSA